MVRKKIVVVEDEADIREVIEYNFTRDGYKVVSTANGEKALKIIKK